MIKTCFFIILFTLIILSNVIANDLKPYKVYLKEGTVLTSLVDKKDQRITRGIYVYVLETDYQKRDMFIVYDKNMKPAFETTALGVVEIKKDIAILPEVDAEVIYPPPTVLNASNKNAFLDTQVNIYIESIGPGAFNSLYSTEYPNAYGNRYEVRTLYNSTLPVNFGLSLNYFTATWLVDDGDMKLSALSFGPRIQHYIYFEEKMAVSLLFGTDFSPNYHTSINTFTDKYYAVILNLGTEVLWQNYFGKWSAGIHFRRHDLSLMSSTRKDFSPFPEDLTVYSIGAMLGYKYEWDL